MYTKTLNGLLVITSFFGYLEWGQNNAMFLYEAEMEILIKLFTNPLSALHPFTVLPLVGQLLLIISLFQRQPNKWLTWLGTGGIGILFLLMFIIGLISFNWKIFISTLPFLIVVVVSLVMKRSKH